jgi:multidrug efflux system outer membrane protein
MTRPLILRRKTMNKLSSLLGVLLLSSCVVGPDYEKPEVDSPETWRIDYQAASEVSNTRWWQQFQDPVLVQLIGTALLENKDVRIAAARMQEFAARIEIAHSGFLPQIGYDNGISRNRTSRNAFGSLPDNQIYNNYTASANLSWELDLWGKIRRSEEAATAEFLAQKENRRSLILSLVSTVATTYVTLRQLDSQLQTSRNTLQTRTEALRLFRLKYKGGVISELELAQVRTEYERAAAAIPPLQRRIAITENELSILLGKNPGKIPRGKTIDQLVLPQIPAGIPSVTLEKRPDIRAAEQQLISANARIGVAKAEYFPTISLTGALGFVSTNLGKLLNNSSNTWSIGASALGPIYTGGRLSAEVAATEAVQRQALTGYLKAVQNGFREVEDSLISVQKFREQLKAEGNRVDALKNYARLAMLRYNEGYASYIEVLDAQRELFNAELQYIAVQGNVYTALVSTYKAMGGGWVDIAQKSADKVDFPKPPLPPPPKEPPPAEKNSGESTPG